MELTDPAIRRYTKNFSRYRVLQTW